MLNPTDHPTPLFHGLKPSDIVFGSGGPVLVAQVAGTDFTHVYGLFLAGLTIVGPVIVRALSAFAVGAVDRWAKGRAESAEVIELRGRLQVLESIKAILDMKDDLEAVVSPAVVPAPKGE